ncbi:MAG: DUF2970 domain-containing protein [Parahaliea sp.]
MSERKPEQAQQRQDQQEAHQQGGQQDKNVGPLQVLSSVFAAGFGVQSSRNRERDFKQGRFGVFVVAGIVFTLLFIGTVFAVVQVVLRGAGH